MFDIDTYLLVMFEILLIGMFICVGIDATESAEANVWNEGTCECGGTWVYEEAVPHLLDTDYIYKCDTCGKVHQFRNIYVVDSDK